MRQLSARNLLHKVFAVFLSIAIVISLAPSFALAASASRGGDVSPAAEIVHAGTFGGCEWTIDADGLLTIVPYDDGDGGKGDGVLPSDAKPWADYSADIKSATIGPGVSGDASFMFSECPNLTSVVIVGLTPTIMNHMFYKCDKLESVDLSGLNTSNVTSMSSAFLGCKSLVYIDLLGFRTPLLEDVSYMFDGCSALISLDLTAFDFSKVRATSGIFSDCSSLRNVNFGEMFPLDYRGSLPEGLWTSRKTGETFSAARLMSLAATGEMKSLSGAYDKEEVILPIEGTADGCHWKIDKNNHLTIEPASGVSSANAGVLPEVKPWTEYYSYINSVTVAGGVKGNARNMFAGCSNITAIEISDMSVTDAAAMFSDCKKLTKLTFSGFDTSEATNMSRMFSGCEALSSLDLSGFETSKVTSMRYMFALCSSMKDLNLSKFNTPSLTDATCMFLECSALASLNLESFDTTNTTQMGEMFFNADKLSEIVLGEKFAFGNGVNLPAGYWQSKNDGKYYTADQVASDRKGIADTYKKAAGPVILDAPDEPLTWSPESESAPTFRSSAPLSEFEKVLLDDKVVDPSNYDVREGSTVVELHSDYLAKLPEGEHTVSIVSKSGTATAPLIIEGTGISADPETPSKPDDQKPEGQEPSGDDQQSSRVTMHRLYNPNSGEHFFTANTNEKDHLISLGWNDEGVGWTAPKEGTAVYRLYNPVGGEHHYTMSEGEKNYLVSLGWNDEGIGWYSDAEKSVALHRLYNPNEFANNHHYTTSAAEKAHLLSLGWKDEGIGWHGIG